MLKHRHKLVRLAEYEKVERKRILSFLHGESVFSVLLRWKRKRAPAKYAGAKQAKEEGTFPVSVAEVRNLRPLLRG